MIKFRRVLVLLIVVVSMLVVTASAEWTTTDRNYLSSIKTDATSIKNYCSTLVTKITSIDTNVSYIYTRVTSINDKLTTTNSHLANIATYTNSMNTKLGTIGTSLDNIEIYTKWIVDCYNRLGDVTTGINTTNGHLEFTNSYLSDIHDVIASEEDKALKDEAKDETITATDVFSSSDSVSNVSNVGGFSSAFTDYFTIDSSVGAAEYSTMFTYLDEGTNSWFSSQTATALYKGGGQAMISGVMTADYEEPETPLLDARIQSVKDAFGWE